MKANRKVVGGDGAPSVPTEKPISFVVPNRQLLIDVSTIARFDAGTGIQRVVRAIAAALQENPAPGTRIRLVAASKDIFYRLLPDDWLGRAADRQLDLEALPEARAESGDIFFGLDFSASILPHHDRKIAEWRRRGVSINIVLYDLLPLFEGRWFSFRMRTKFRRWLKTVQRHSHQVIAISQTVASEFEDWQRQSDRSDVPVAVARLGSDISASLPSRGLPSDSEEVLSWMRRSPTVLMVGTVEPRKGYDQALKAFRRLWTSSDAAPQLMIVGRAGWKTSRLQKDMRELAGSQERFRWLEGVSDEFLENIYRNATGLLVASRGEGFGLPIVEGRSHGLPILVRDIPVFRELQGPGLTFFCNSRSEISGEIRQWLESIGGSCETAPVPTTRWKETADDIVGILMKDVVVDSPAERQHAQ